jgi:hypothetical protein
MAMKVKAMLLGFSVIAIIILSCTDGVFPIYEGIRIRNFTNHDIQFSSYSGDVKNENFSFNIKSNDFTDVLNKRSLGGSPSILTIEELSLDSIVLQLDLNESLFLSYGGIRFASLNTIAKEHFFLISDSDYVTLDKAIKIDGKRVKRINIYDINESDLEALRRLNEKQLSSRK